MNATTTPTFKTSRLILRPLQPSDIPSYQKNFADYEVISELAAVVPWPYPADGVEQYLNAVIFPNQGVDHWDWGIFLKTDPTEEVIGTVNLFRKGRPENRGFWLARKYWGQGLMTEAVQPVTDYAFGALGFEKLLFSNAVGNTRSRRVKEKAGARLISTIPFKFVNPSYTHAEIWELTRQEWETSQK